MSYFDDQEARSIIRDTYSSVRSDSTAVAETLYAPDELAGLPVDAVALALGVGHPVRHAALRAGESVLDLGCGAGIDTLLAAAAVGPSGRVVGLDMTPEMVARARRNCAASGFDHVEIRVGLIEEIPLPDSAMDVAISNGVLNLSTRKSRVLAETMRVLRPGGRVSITDLVLTEALPEDVLKSPAALAGWLAGTLAEPVLLKKFFNVGFEAIEVVDRRWFGLGDLSRYPLFAPEFLEFMRKTMPSSRHDELVSSIAVTARKPASPTNGSWPSCDMQPHGTDVRVSTVAPNVPRREPFELSPRAAHNDAAPTWRTAIVDGPPGVRREQGSQWTWPAPAASGYDSAPLAIGFAEANLAKSGVGNVTFHHAAANALPRNASFDFILTWDCLHDMTHPAEAMRAIRAAITPDGTWSTAVAVCMQRNIS